MNKKKSGCRIVFTCEVTPPGNECGYYQQKYPFGFGCVHYSEKTGECTNREARLQAASGMLFDLTVSKIT